MTGLIQRLLDRAGVVAPAAAPVVSLARSTSPVAMADQRLQDPAFRDLAPGWPDSTGGDPVTDPVPEALPDAGPLHPRNRPDPPAPLAQSLPRATSDFPERPRQEPSALPPILDFTDPIAALRAAARTDPPLPVAPVRTVPQDQPPSVVHPQPPVAPVALDPPAPDLGPVPTAAPAVPAARRPPAPVGPAAQPGPVPVPATVMPRSATPVVSDLPRLVPDAELATPAPSPAPNTLRPIVTPAVAADVPDRPEAAAAAPAAVRTVERIVERVLDRQPTTRPQPEPRRTDRPTAESVSRIGPLPARRRTHTLFGLRRM